MAGIDVGGHGKRSSNHEIPLIPFIDFLLCLVMFLLVTAVWSQMARIEADAKVPGPPKEDPMGDPPKEKELHIEMRGERKFQLIWKEGTTVVNTIDVDRKEVPVNEDVSYPDLGKKIEAEWKTSGSHRNAVDKRFDRAILHTDNSTEFKHVVAVLDAIYVTKREFAVGGTSEQVPAFQVTFAVD
jgi:biopolymer transport protein ExbD